MSYMHIDNLYKNNAIMLFKDCYALEKIHGTSAHVGWTATNVEENIQENLTFFSGGCDHFLFQSLFNQDDLRTKLRESKIRSAIFYGEAYGGKLQKMSQVYGNELRFVVFEVKMGETWLDVSRAEWMAKCLGFDFVPYEIIPCTIEALDEAMKKPSVQSKKNGIDGEHLREGIVVRPLKEMMEHGTRIIAKHKNPEFSETKTPRPLDQSKWAVLEDARAIATEWVTEMRLSHVLDGLGIVEPFKMEDTGNVIRAMLEDVAREASGEVVMSSEAKKAISTTTAKLYKSKVTTFK
jgi:hypothetical protein